MQWMEPAIIHAATRLSVYILILPRCPLRRRNPSGQSMGILLLSISEDFNDSAIGDMLNV